jgi:hypothetical protein
MPRKRTTTEGFIECPFDEEDIISSSEYDSIMGQTSPTATSKNKPNSHTSNLFYFQSINK